MPAMILYTCGFKKFGGSLHPCAKAANAVDDAGYEYELKTVSGYKNIPFTRRGDSRDEIEKISGQQDVPVLVLDDGEVISGSGEIVEWAEAHPAAASVSAAP